MNIDDDILAEQICESSIHFIIEYWSFIYCCIDKILQYRSTTYVLDICTLYPKKINSFSKICFIEHLDLFFRAFLQYCRTTLWTYSWCLMPLQLTYIIGPHCGPILKVNQYYEGSEPTYLTFKGLGSYYTLDPIFLVIRKKV